MALIATFEKQPADVLDYDIDYTTWLPDTDAIASATATVTPEGGMSVDLTLVIENNTRVKIWVSGGTNGITYKVTVTTTTADGRVKQDEFRVKVKDI